MSKDSVVRKLKKCCFLNVVKSQKKNYRENILKIWEGGMTIFSLKCASEPVGDKDFKTALTLSKSDCFNLSLNYRQLKFCYFNKEESG